MSNLNQISRGEVFYIISTHNTVGSEQKSGRPAVIVSNNTNNDHSSCVEICYMTLQEKTPLPTHVFFGRGQCINSTILCEQVTTVSKERLGDYVCTLPDDVMDEVDRAIVVSLGLDYIIEKDSKIEKSQELLITLVSVLEELDKLRADNKALEAKNMELSVACDTFKVRAEKAELLSSTAETYKTLYNELLDKVLRR